MIVLYRNLLDDGATTTTSADANYPLTNLLNIYSRNRTLLALYKSATGVSSATITTTLASAATVDALGIGNHNLAQVVVTLKDSIGTTIATETLSATDLATDYSSTKLTQLSTAYTGVYSIKLALSSAQSQLYVGGLYVGESLTLQPAEAFQPVQCSLTGSADVSLRGVVFGQPGVRLDSIQWPMRGLTRAQLDSYLAMYDYSQTTQPMFIDPNPGTAYRHWFARLSDSSISYQVYEGGDYDMALSFQEVR